MKLTEKLIYAVLLIWLSACSSQAKTGGDLEILTITTTAGKEVRYSIEVADTESSRLRGLMYRKSLPADQGMLFDFKTSGNISMWMRNTYIPLDMLFIDGKGVIMNIARETEPLSTRSIHSKVKVRYVFEVNAKQADTHGIRVGDRISLARLKQ